MLMHRQQLEEEWSKKIAVLRQDRESISSIVIRETKTKLTIFKRMIREKVYALNYKIYSSY